MKPYIYSLIIACTIFSFSTAPCIAQTNKNTTYIIPINEMIERGLVYVIRRGIQDAVKEDAKIIIFDMHTRGGRLDATEEIIRMLMDLPDSITTYTFINTDALSAGSMIAMATDHIYMAPGSRIGASAPVAGGKDIESKDMKEKVVSSIIALVGDAAKRKGHDEHLVEAMVRKEYEYKIGKKVICETGKLLTLTSSQAEELVGEKKKERRKLLSEGTVKDLDELKEKLGIKNVPVKTLSITTAEKIARWIEVYSFIFMTLGMLGIYIEFKTPGFGIPGVAGILFLAIFFWGHNIAGLAGMGEVIVFTIGVVLLLLEIFVVPGFGITGISGITLIFISLAMAMVQHSPTLPIYKLPPLHLEGAINALGLSIISTFFGILLLAKFLPKTPIFNKIALNTAMTAETGYTASKDTNELVGKRGVADTPLHPSGIGVFDDKRINVVTRGDFIEKDTSIVVVESHGSRIVVESANKA